MHGAWCSVRATVRLWCGVVQYGLARCRAILSGDTNATQSIVYPKINEITVFCTLSGHKYDTHRKILVCVNGRHTRIRLRHTKSAENSDFRVSKKQSRVSASRHKHIFLTNRSPGIIQLNSKSPRLPRFERGVSNIHISQLSVTQHGNLHQPTTPSINWLISFSSHGKDICWCCRCPSFRCRRQG